MIPDGYILWARVTTNSEIFLDKPDVWFKVWFFIVSYVNYQKVGRFDRGENFFNYALVHEKIRSLTSDQWKKCLAALRKMEMIRTTKSTRGVIIKVLNYDQYQTSCNYKAPQNAPHRHHYKQEVKKEEINNNRAMPLFKEKKRLSDLTDAMSSTLEKIKNSKPARNVPDWMAHALEVADKLHIDWNHPELVKANMKARWFSLFKRIPWGKLQSAYSFCYDYPNKPDSAGIVKLFFWRVANKT